MTCDDDADEQYDNQVRSISRRAEVVNPGSRERRDGETSNDLP